MLDINIVALGKMKEKYYQDACLEYLKRLKPYARIKITELEPVAFGRSDKIKSQREESAKIENYLAKVSGAQIILLDEKGKLFDSLTFADNLAKISRPLVLVLGGALGFSLELKSKYPAWSLSKLTYPHELARVILLEQLYRAAAILSGKDYHY